MSVVGSIEKGQEGLILGICVFVHDGSTASEQGVRDGSGIGAG
jgi:hypothetical protein